MAVLVGIDEAGFGPLLGPLVVSSSGFFLPDELLQEDLWRILKKSAAKRRKHLLGRLLITDSKKAYTRATGLKHLSRTVLAVLKCLEKEPANLGELIAFLSPDLLERLDSYPWYKDAAARLLDADGADIAIAAGVFVDDAAARGIRPAHLSSCCLDVAHYNRMVLNVKNKANVLFTATCGLIAAAFKEYGRDNLQIVVDRQGGRVHYRKTLLRMFPECDLTILQETPRNSSYQLQDGNRKMRLHFAVGADDRFLPVSLASMTSKYMRELLIGCLNHYFASFHSDLRPTAGYWQDGRRFVRDIQEKIPNLTYDVNQLIRSR